MFKKNKRHPSTEPYGGAEPQYYYGEPVEWEEIIEDDTGEIHSSLPEYEVIENEPAPAYSEPPINPVYSQNTSDRGIELDGGMIDVSDFPALRLVFDQEEVAVSPLPEEKPTELIEYTAQSDGEDGLSWLIRRYAELDEQEEAARQAETEETDEPGDEIPELFRVGDRGEAVPLEEEEEEPDDFTMEGELQKQRHISGELFEYISTIESDQAENKRQRERTSVRIKKYDPYNMNFNNRFDDGTDELENTPEISIPQKYEFTSGSGEDA